MAMSGIFKGRWTIWILSLFFALLAGFGTLVLLGSASSQVSYYTITASVAARTQINLSEVTEISVPQSSLPPTALTLAQINSGSYYTVIGLEPGTVLTTSVAKMFLPSLSSGLQPGYVMSSLLITPENAAGGRVKAGDFVDIAALSGTDPATAESKIVLQHVLVIDVAVSANTVADTAGNSNNGTPTTPGPDSAALYGGIPQMYTFAVSSQDFTKLALIRTSSIYLALTSGPAVASLDATTNASTLFLPGGVAASSPDASAVPVSTSAKTSVESFYSKSKASGYSLTVIGSDLVASNDNGDVIGKIALSGGAVDLETGIYTAAK